MNEFHEKISIVVPVYQASQYLNDCLDSLAKQTYKNIEVILVDDGSQDGSGNICDHIVDKDHRFKVVHQENQGVSTARNNGLKICTGEYIMFVDSDDWLEPCCCESALKKIHESKSDICFFEMYVIENVEKKETKALALLNQLTTKTELLHLTIPFRDGDSVDDMVVYGPYCKLFKRNVILGLSFFNDLRYGEDAIFNFEAIHAADNYCFLHEQLYNYRKNESSTTASFKHDRLEQSILRLKYTYKVICMTEQREELKLTYYQMFVNINFWVMERMFSGKGKSLKKSWTEFRKLTDDDVLKKIWGKIHSKGKYHRALEMLYSGNRLINTLLFLRLRY